MPKLSQFILQEIKATLLCESLILKDLILPEADEEEDEDFDNWKYCLKLGPEGHLEVK